MLNQSFYNQWSASYDAVDNKTRDLEKTVAQKLLADLKPETIIELGCGTGKNTDWLAVKAKLLIAVDFSDAMLAKARQKVRNANVEFHQFDITSAWTFTDRLADLVTCSLVMEHISDIARLFKEVVAHLKIGGYFYICELHPYKQYNGSKARFQTEQGTVISDCYVHHISDYLLAAEANNLALHRLDEWFDSKDRSGFPRLVSILLRKTQ